MNIVSSMQGAVATLQSMVNGLLQEQSGTDKTISTHADKTISTCTFADKTETTTGHCRNLQNGIASDELAHIDVVTDSVKKNILAGKYVNLACVLIPDYETPTMAPENLSGLDFLKRDSRDHRLDRQLSISQFFKAFGVYKRIMCKAFPLRRTELDLYEADIGNIYSHYGDIFYQYHVQFSKQAAAYLGKGIKVEWAKRDNGLFQLLICGAETKICEHWLQVDHESPFCPSQIG